MDKNCYKCGDSFRGHKGMDLCPECLHQGRSEMTSQEKLVKLGYIVTTFPNGKGVKVIEPFTSDINGKKYNVEVASSTVDNDTDFLDKVYRAKDSLIDYCK